MKKFTSEFKNEHPELFKARPVVKTKVVKSRNPLWLLPLVLRLISITALSLTGVGGFLHNQKWASQETVAALEAKIETLNNQVKLNDDLIVLTMIVNNENACIMRNITNVNSFMMFEKDRSIKRLPTHLHMTQEDVDRITKKYLKK